MRWKVSKKRQAGCQSRDPPPPRQVGAQDKRRESSGAPEARTSPRPPRPNATASPPGRQPPQAARPGRSPGKDMPTLLPERSRCSTHMDGGRLAGAAAPAQRHSKATKGPRAQAGRQAGRQRTVPPAPLALPLRIPSTTTFKGAIFRHGRHS